MHSKTKHIPIKYHFLREQVAEKNIRVEYVGTKEQKNKWHTSLQNHFHGKPLNIFSKDLELFLLQNECFFNSFWMLILDVLYLHEESP